MTADELIVAVPGFFVLLELISARLRELQDAERDADPTMDFGLSKYAANCGLNFLWNRAAITAAVLKQGMGRAT